MPKFATKKLTVITGRDPFYQLCVGDVGILDQFEKDIENNAQESAEIKALYTYMQYFSEGKLPPKTKFRELKGAKGSKEYEFKTKHLRIYAFKIAEGKLVAVAGHKNTQDEDISRFRSLKKQFESSLK